MPGGGTLLGRLFTSCLMVITVVVFRGGFENGDRAGNPAGDVGCYHTFTQAIGAEEKVYYALYTNLGVH